MGQKKTTRRLSCYDLSVRWREKKNSPLRIHNHTPVHRSGYAVQIHTPYMIRIIAIREFN